MPIKNNNSISKYTLEYDNKIYVTLRFWCDYNVLPYERFKEKARNNEAGYLKTDTRYWVYENQIVPKGYNVTCEICNKKLTQITYTHLKLHNLTIKEYQELYPNAKIFNEITNEKIYENACNVFNNDEAREKSKIGIQETFKNGRVVHNKGVTGIFCHSEETIQKIKKLQNNPEHRERIYNTWRKNRDAGLHKEKGQISDQGKENIRNGVKNRKPLTEEQKENLIQRNKEQFTGVPKSIKARENMRIARINYIVNNPELVKPKLFNTKPEQEFKKLCDKHNVEVIHQYHTKNYSALYDFYLPYYNILVEIDGPIHWQEDYYVHKKAVNQKDSFTAIQLKDLRKNEIAKQLGMKILRIKVIYNLNDVQDVKQQVINQGFNELLFLFQ